MGLSKKKIHGIEFLYFQEHKKSLLIGKVGEYNKGNSKNVSYAITSNDSRIDKLLEKYVEEVKELSLYLPGPERNEYLSKRTAVLLARLRRLEELQKVKQAQQVSLGKGSPQIVSSSVAKKSLLPKSRKYLSPSTKEILEESKKKKKKKVKRSGKKK